MTLKEKIDEKLKQFLGEKFNKKGVGFKYSNNTIKCIVGYHSNKFKDAYYLDVSFVLNDVEPYIEKISLNNCHLSKQFRNEFNEPILISVNNIDTFDFKKTIESNVNRYIDLFNDKDSLKENLYSRILQEFTIYSPEFFINIHSYLNIELPPKWR